MIKILNDKLNYLLASSPPESPRDIIQMHPHPLRRSMNQLRSGFSVSRINIDPSNLEYIDITYWVARSNESSSYIMSRIKALKEAMETKQQTEEWVKLRKSG